MTMIRNIIVALSMYSRIPMPHFEWKENDMKYALGFIGLVGFIIGGIEYGLITICKMYDIPTLVASLLWCTVPLIITGGFHVDGFMDVQDAFNSYKPKEEKLKILKDPHIGAFSVISLVVYACLYLSAVYMLIDTYAMKHIAVCCIGFALVRALGAYVGTIYTHSQKEGMLHEETKTTGIAVKLILLVTIVICLIAISILGIINTVFVSITLMIFTIWFKQKCYREFGGVSGDTIGFFITEGELLLILVMAILCKINV